MATLNVRFLFFLASIIGSSQSVLHPIQYTATVNNLSYKTLGIRCVLEHKFFLLILRVLERQYGEHTVHYKISLMGTGAASCNQTLLFLQRNA